MKDPLQLNDIARIPLPGDNVAIATRRLEAGLQIASSDQTFSLDYTILEGHRFALQPIAVDEPLLSWSLPFGRASAPIQPGQYVCNAGMLEALGGRSIDFPLPPAPNFRDEIKPYQLAESQFQPAEQVALYDRSRTFLGYRRPGQRGVGTRNTIVLLGTTSRTGSFVKQLEARLSNEAAHYANIDNVVAVAHTEGGTGSKKPNNLDLLLRTLAGFMIHPNVGAVLAVDYGTEPVTNEMLRHYMLENDYPLADVPHHFLSLTAGFQTNLKEAETIVRDWLPQVNAAQRSEESVAHLKIALQCGGSDAFSGISGNPLASWVAKEIIRYGGAANLAETDELIGAESYVLQKVKDVATARKFLATVERFKERVGWHGSTAEGNPSGGNKFRGLYNIVLKSIGAAMKRHPDVRLDHVIEYGAVMAQPGYYFMDSPGNDLESIAGQVASGCTMIFFVTGNGSITNFPFVPTLKVVTTTQRYALLSQEMDVNAGAYLDGAPMDEVGQQMLDLTVDVASGQQSVGEKAGHAQVQIWRDWAQQDNRNLAELLKVAPPNGQPIPLEPSASDAATNLQFQAIRTPSGWATAQVGLILPTSLCAGQIARMTADALNRAGLGREQGLAGFVSLVHTEGCGVSGGPAEELYIRTLLGYLSHPLVKHALLLEHGCEKTHNDYMQQRMMAAGLDLEQFGWASIQLDGGIEAVLEKMTAWFTTQVAGAAKPERASVGLAQLRVGLLNAGPLSDEAGRQLAQLSQIIAGAGGTVVVPEQTDLLATSAFQQLSKSPLAPSLAHGQKATASGFHIMENPSSHWTETLTGLAATGVELIIAHIGGHPMQSHPLVPVIQITTSEAVQNRYGADIDLVLTEAPETWPGQILQHLVAVIERRHTPKLHQQGNIDFQITRGLLGVSM